ncbi:MAG: Gfo/Idh/MocA family oxidoreductase, partial [Peptidiphaga sp.]
KTEQYPHATKDAEGRLVVGAAVGYWGDTWERASALAEAGVPVYLEKPLAITIEGADRILTTARRTGTRLYVGHNMRHMEVVRLLKSVIDSRTMGLSIAHRVSPVVVSLRPTKA